MAYATIEDAKTMYGEELILTSVTRADTPDEEAFTVALTKATSEIDSYARAQYTTPLSPVPDIVQRYCIDIAIYTASADAGTTTVEKRTRYEDALKWLKLLAAGTVTLDLDDDGEADNVGGGLPEISGPDRVFSRTSMRGL